MARSIAIVALLTLTGALVWGCSNPADNEDPPDLPYPLRSSPDSLMVQFVWAYENMDLDVYLDCFAEGFIFFLNPSEVEEDPGLEPGYWGKAEERAIHEEMFGEDGAESIALTLTQDGDPIATEPTPGDTHWQYRESVDLRVYVIWDGVPTTLWATAPSMFEFRIDRDQEGPNGEPLWEIVHWYDLSASQRSGSRESSSWGSIKALFRQALASGPGDRDTTRRAPR